MENKNKAALFLIIVFFSFLLVSCSSAKEISVAPEFSLQAAHNTGYSIVTLSSYKDRKPVILFFWTSWCPYCRKEINALNKRYSQLAADGVELLAVNVGETPDKVDRIIKNSSFLFTVLLDKNTDVAQEYNIMGIPTYVFIDRKGGIIFKGNSFVEEKYKEILRSK